MSNNIYIEQTFEWWLEEYKPIPNHFDENASFQDEDGIGIMFETYGDEIEFVKKADPRCIWTYHHGDNNSTYIVNGFGFVNRLGYFISEVPCPENTEVFVTVQEDNYMCENCEEEYYENVDEMYDTWGDLSKCPKCATLEEKETHNA